MKKLVGKVSYEEKQQIEALFERKNGLTELAKILPVDNPELYEKVVRDLGETTTKFQNWWNEMGQKYQWESSPNGNWEIAFDKCEIYLITSE